MSVRGFLSVVMASLVALLVAPVGVDDADAASVTHRRHYTRVKPGSADDLLTWLSRKSPRHVAQSKRPNIVVVMADDMRYDDLRFAPHVRSLARKGVTFDNVFSSYPLCCPARASFFSGQLPHNHGVMDTRRPYGYQTFNDARSLATALKAAGYRTGFVGKYLNGYGRDRSLVSGKRSFTYVPRGWTDWAATFAGAHAKGIKGGTYQYFRSPFNVNGKIDDRRFRGRYQTDIVGKFSRALVKKYAAKRAPYFLSINFVAPHDGTPAEPDDPAPFRRGGESVDLTTPARPEWVKGIFDDQVTRAPGVALNGSVEQVAKNKPRPFAKLPPLRKVEKDALTEVTRQRAEAIYVMDKRIGQLVAQLKSAGEWRNTVLIVTSDNGFFLGEHRWLTGKRWGYEPSLRIPLIVAGKNIPKREHRTDPVTMVDLTATILDIAGASPPRTPDGASRLATLKKGDRGWTRPVLYEAMVHGIPDAGLPEFHDARDAIGVRTAQYAYFRYIDGSEELYDLATDPQEFSNVASWTRYQGVLGELREVWAGLVDCVGAECRRPLPADLRTDPKRTRELADLYAAGIKRIYG